MGCVLSYICTAYQTFRILLALIEEVRADLSAALVRISLPSLPILNPSVSFWQQNPIFPELVYTRSTTLPATADVVIIGSGISGASIAHTILSTTGSDKNLRVVVLEAREICSGATGRNGGHIKCSPYVTYARFKTRFGSERAKKMLAFEKKALPLLAEFVRENNFEHAEAREVETLDIYTDKVMWDNAKAMVHSLREELPDAARDVEIYEADVGCKVYRITCPSGIIYPFPLRILTLIIQKFGVSQDHCFGIISYRAGALWPYRFVTSLYAKLLSMYATSFSIETSTLVTDIKTRGNIEAPFLVHTSRGEIAAKHVIHATDAFASALLPGIRGKLFPIRGHMTAQRPGHKFPEFGGSRSWSIIGRRGYEYVSQRPGNPRQSVNGQGGELMIGGGAAQSPGKGIDECGIWRDDQSSGPVGAYLEGILPTIFGKDKWGDDVDGSRVKQAWVGCMGFTADLLPYVGKLDSDLTGRHIQRDDQRPNSGRGGGKPGREMGPPPAEWISAGFGGEGMVLAWLSGAAVALMVLGLEDSDIQGFPGLPDGRLMDWLPEEFICSKRRVDRSSFSGLLELL